MQTDHGTVEGYEGIERRSYEFVPLEERGGSRRGLFFMWFGINAQVYALVTGAIGVSLGLSVWWTLLAIVAGNLVGALFMAFHSAQGPILGLPQMIQSRAQFGYYGAILPLVIVWVMYIAFAATDIVLAGQALNTVFPALNLNLAMVLVTIPMTLIAIYGYRWIHKFLQYETWFYIAFFVFLSIIFLAHGVPSANLAHGHFSVGTFLLTVSIVAVWQISYAPYVSDYSRYLPPKAAKGTFWITYWGTTLSSIWLMILGAGIQSLAPSASSMMPLVAGLGGHTGGLIMTFLLGIGLIAPNSTNVYGGAITTLSVASNVREFTSTPRLRVWVCVIVAAISVLVSTVGAGNFLTNLENYMTILLYFLIPWTAINLTDFYLIHRGRYETSDFFRRDGAFGRFGVVALSVYIVGFLVEIPFMNTIVYAGPVSKLMGGADISWVVGLAVSFALYYTIQRSRTAVISA